LTSIDAIKAVISDIRIRRRQWLLSRRAKNIETLTILAMQESVVFDLIYERLTWRDYLAGPEPDNHSNAIPGSIWVFGLTIEGIPCYLKFQDRPNGVVMWISIHQAAFPLAFPYK